MDHKYEYDAKKIVNGDNTQAWSNVYEVTIKDSKGLIDGKKFKYQDAVSGCGLAIIRGIASELTLGPTATYPQVDDDKQVEAFSEALIGYFKGVSTVGINRRKGCILCTLGDSSMKYEPRVLKMKFIKIHELINPVHSLTYKQRIYALNIDNL